MKAVKVLAALMALALMWELRWLFILGFIAVVIAAVVVFVRRRRDRAEAAA